MWRGSAALPSLVGYAVNGMVACGLDEVLPASGKRVPETETGRERAAAAERLACYWAYCEDMTADAELHLTSKYQAGAPGRIRFGWTGYGLKF